MWMRRIAFALVVVACAVPALADRRPNFILINCDDLGSTRAANVAIYDALRDGLATSASLMVPCPWAREAAEAGMAQAADRKKSLLEFAKKKAIELGRRQTFVTADDVQAAAQRYLTPRNRTVGWLIPVGREGAQDGSDL